MKRGAGVLLLVTTEKYAGEDKAYSAALEPEKFRRSEKEPAAEDETEKEPSNDSDDDVNVICAGLVEMLDELEPVDVLTTGTTVTFLDGR